MTVKRFVDEARRLLEKSGAEKRAGAEEPFQGHPWPPGNGDPGSAQLGPQTKDFPTFTCPRCGGVVKVQHPGPGVWAISFAGGIRGCESCQRAKERLARALENAWD